MKFDVFISYRRKGGSVVARLLQSELERNKYSVFLDVDSLREGHFDENLFRHIENSKNFVVVLTDGCLDRCVNNEDWLRKEIAHAFKIGRHVIPVMMPEFEFPVDLPTDIRELPRHNAVSYSHDYFKGTMEKLCKFLEAGSTDGVAKPPNTLPVAEQKKAVLAPAAIRQVLSLGAPPPPKPAERRAGETDAVDLGVGVKLELAWCPPGSFLMGSPAGEAKRSDDETQHRVTLTKGFWMGNNPVTQRQWESVMGGNPSNFKGADLPVEKVSWDDCQAFIAKLNEKLAARGDARPPTVGTGGRASPRAGAFRLPTEAEWEYACRAGTTGPYAGDLDAMAWYSANSGLETHPVGQKKANSWGLYDMHGNVWEWCQDWYGGYPAGSVTDPAGPGSGSGRVIRGGSWSSSAGRCRSANRDYDDPGGRLLGLRLERDPQ